MKYGESGSKFAMKDPLKLVESEKMALSRAS